MKYPWGTEAHFALMWPTDDDPGGIAGWFSNDVDAYDHLKKHGKGDIALLPITLQLKRLIEQEQAAL